MRRVLLGLVCEDRDGLEGQFLEAEEVFVELLFVAREIGGYGPETAGVGFDEVV